MLKRHANLLVAAAALLALPSVLSAFGLTLTSATDVALLAMACMALNLLVGYTGLVSFGHGAWFGLGAYAAALLQVHVAPGLGVVLALPAMLLVGLCAVPIGFVVLRRRGVYFSLLTLAFTALLYTIAYRWTALTGGENGLGGVRRGTLFGLNLEQAGLFYVLIALVVFCVVFGLQRFVRSPLGSVLVAIRENEQRARFIGYDTTLYKIACFALSAAITALAGALMVFNHRFASADPIAVAFSGELLAMVVIGGMRSFLGPALGALFYVLFREFLSMWTPNWLFWFGLLFMAFIVFSPTGLVGVAGRLVAPLRKPRVTDAAMGGRTGAQARALPAALIRPAEAGDGAPVLEAKGLARAFGGIKAVENGAIAVRDRTLHALIGPNGAGKTTAFNLISGMFKPDAGEVRLAGARIDGLSPDKVCARGLARSFQITNLFPALSVHENLRLGVQATHARRFDPWTNAAAIAAIDAETREMIAFLGVAGMEQAEAGALSYGGQRLLDMGLALTSRPRILLLDEPLAGLAAAERARVSALIKQISAEVPVLLVEHDIDRVFELADAVTVMADGAVLVDGTVEDARSNARVQEVYIGSGSAALAGRDLVSAATDRPMLALSGVDAFYGKSRILTDVALEAREGEIVALLGRNGAGKSTLLKTVMGIVPPAAGRIALAGADLAGRTPAAIAQRGVGYVPQGRALFSGMSVRHNLELGRLKRRTGAGRHFTEAEVLDLFPRLRQRLDTPADLLSGGEQQMVAVARALVGDTRLLLLDEPFEGLSPAVTEELFDAFDRLRHRVTLVIVDHHLDVVLNLADRAVVLERGQVVHEGPARPLARDLDLRRSVLWL
ncbi:branched-chain amino acid ABC transporter ATP-binding protein/permease [Aquabacter spiritensis]|uniref:ABC-type sugar transport system ATPase subunit n=1 Tax=Aquabacter spiritensis TaxID=933073 RepID=A0A4R3M426_9HYPH|nr:branched-chain amino acid ABC transporter ATP-binding protein/permease [Aquabacter spiritensis]TCT07792.1 ABC-type sugar transport system ATPase subunit [Aquabacter spiritensis]